VAQLVGGIGMSHSSLVVLPEVDFWRAHDPIDRKNPHLRDRSGAVVAYADLEERNGARYAAQASPEALARQIEAMGQALERLRADVEALRPDVLVVFGDDQQEFHDETNLPTLGVYYGAELTMGTSMRFATYQEELGDTTPLMRGYAMDDRHVFPGHPELALALIESLHEQGFDVAASGGVPDDGVSGLGHAFGIVETQLMAPGSIPLVPVFVNTYWAPNQIGVSRSYDLGRAVARAIADFDADLRVVVVASGGLSHFSTDEQLDRRVLDACAAADEEALRGFERELLNGGSSEIRNWIAVAAACRELPLDWSEYLPVYRTPAGTGVGLAFATWRAA
jgi:3-O-methylgallate 3,4-dioxygenase